VTHYKSWRIIDGRPSQTIVDENGSIINRHPNKEELICLEEEIPRGNGNYNPTNTCEFVEKDDKRCAEKLYPRNARQFNIDGKVVWFCERHSGRYNTKLPNSQNCIMKALANIRTGNQNPNHEGTKADMSQELACKLYGWIDLNKKYDNHRSQFDCYDQITGLYHQVQMRCYSAGRSRWPFTSFEREWEKKFEDMVCLCISEDGKIIERIYKFPWKEITRLTGISIYKSRRVHWYDKYRVKDEDELKKAGDIWKNIILENI
jgi:hypothetical protein